jgi:hypothetical protein
MYVQIDQRDPKASQSLLSIRQKLMMGFGKQEMEWVLSIRGPSLSGFLQVICQYAEVDVITLLPILIMGNAFALLGTLQEFGLLA